MAKSHRWIAAGMGLLSLVSAPILAQETTPPSPAPAIPRTEPQEPTTPEEPTAPATPDKPAQETPQAPTSEPSSDAGQQEQREAGQVQTRPEGLPGFGETPPKHAETGEPLPISIGDQDARLRRLSPDDAVWFDVRNKLVIVGSEIALQQGPLEMFACPEGTKEHESVLKVRSRAFVVHAALLATGAKPGSPVRFEPEYAQATGTEIQVFVVWEEEGKTLWRRGQEWVFDTRTKKRLEIPWVFGGSGFWQDERTGERHYMAESGELICVSNFTTATMDLPIESSAGNMALLFEATPEIIPPRKTPVTLILAPKLKETDVAPQTESNQPQESGSADDEKGGESAGSGDSKKESEEASDAAQPKDGGDGEAAR